MPNRIIKESICTSDTIDKLSYFEEVVFYRLTVNCDDFGRFDARPKVLSAKLFPLKNIPVDEMQNALNALLNAGLIMVYVVEGRPYLQMTKWLKHQTKRATKSKYPDPDEGIAVNMHADEINCMQMNTDENLHNQMRPYSYSRTYSRSGSERARAREEPAAAAGENPFGEYDESRSDLNTVQAYASRSLRKMSPTYMQELNEFLSEYGLPDDLVRFAIDEACGHDKPYWNYAASILYRYLDAGIKTVADAKAEKEKYRSGKRSNDREDEAHEEELRQQREALKRASDEYDPFDDPNSDSEVVHEVRTMLESGVSVDALRAEARKKIEELHERQRKEAEIWA